MLLVAGVLIDGAYYIGTLKNKPQTQNPVIISQTPQPTAISQTIPISSPTSTNETTSWKTYTNTKYGFSLKYPSELSISSDESQLKDGTFVQFSQASWGIPRMTISIVSDSERVQGNLADLNTILSTKKLGDYTYSLISTQDINGQFLYSFSEDWNSNPGKLPKLPPAGGPLSQLVAMGVIKGSAYNINYLYEDPSKKEVESKDQKIFTQILSTFKFTK